MTSMFGHNIRSELVVLYLAEALTVFLVVYGLISFGMPMQHGRAAVVAGMLALCSGLVSSASGLYQQQLLAGMRRAFTGLAMAGFLLLLAAWLILLIVAPADLRASYAMVLEVLMGCIAAVILTRIAYVLLLRGGFMRRRILVLPGAAASEVTRTPEPAAWRDVFEIAALPANAETAAMLQADRLRAQRIWAVVAAPDEMNATLRRGCDAAGVRVLSEAELHECTHNRVVCESLPADWLATVQAHPESLASAALRRGFDIAVSLGLLIFTLPVMLATALAIKLDSAGPIFYRQERIGLHGQVFTLTKFRSMRTDAEAGGVARWASRQDSRVTRVGRFIRLTRIDELPQILNVLRGDMAFVGPRPERPSFVEELGRIIPRYHDRACVKPGITGWAQVNYPYGASVEDARMKLAYDLYYVQRRSLFLDLLILVATMRVVLLQEGAR
jgi:exopolysaccharide biosynthesis polyprenyl glycosylphosphotransferase